MRPKPRNEVLQARWCMGVGTTTVHRGKVAAPRFPSIFPVLDLCSLRLLPAQPQSNCLPSVRQWEIAAFVIPSAANTSAAARGLPAPSVSLQVA